MKVILTGGAGYIGSHTLLELLANGHEVCVIDNYENSSPVALDRVKTLSNRPFEIHEADIRDRGAISAIFKQFLPDAVIHFAGLKAVGEGEEKPVEYYDTNVTGTLCVVEAMKASGCKKIVFSSSATVYGVPQYLPFDETHPCAPTNVYGRTKLMAEQILEDWASASADTSVALLRYFNPVGSHESGQIGEDPQGIPNNLMPFIAQVAIGRREKLSIFGDDYDTHDGTGMRDYIHVLDLATAHSAALSFTSTSVGVEVFNVGTGKGTTVKELVDAYSRVSGSRLPTQVLERRAGDIDASYADPTKANSKLKWQARFDIDDMCASSWHWQSLNPKGYEK